MYLILASMLTSPGQPIDDAFFENRIRPVLVEHCGKCHGMGEGAKVKGGLRLTSRQALLAGGDNGPAIVPGSPDKSRLISAIEYQDPDIKMPPKGKLPAQAVTDIQRWVAGGAPWPGGGGGAAVQKDGSIDIQARKARHWAWRPLAQPALPNGPGTPIDRLLAAARDSAGVRPAQPADRRTLLRRLSFDLTGLPPTPAETEAFARDMAPDALARQVDRLLASPRFSEHWARHWLDLVRYAETRGHEFDFPIPNAWQYRDYVIRALDGDVPYDRFVLEHLAGDILPEPRLAPGKGLNESVLGTGFYFLGEECHSPVDIRQDEADRIDNRIDVLGKAFLGLTIACARCHDHKFDAISTRDYYSLYGVLESSHYRQARFETAEGELAVGRELSLLREARTRQTGTALAGLLERLAAASGNPGEAIPSVAPAPDFGSDSQPARVLVDYSRLGEGGWLPDGPRFGSGPVPVGAISPGPGGTIAVNIVASARRDGFWPAPTDMPGTQAEPGRLSYPRAGRTLSTPPFQIGSGKVHVLAMGKGNLRACIGSYVMQKGPLHGEMVQTFDHPGQFKWLSMALERYAGLPCHIEFSTDEPGAALAMVVEGDKPRAVPGTRQPIRNPASLLRAAAMAARASKPLAADPTEAAYLAGVLASPQGKDPALAAAVSAWQKDEAALARKIPGPSLLAPACLDSPGINERVFVRGSPRALGETVQRRYLEALDNSAFQGTGSGRLELARKVVDPSISPMVPRVLVNRLWHHLMGRGLIASVDNFGELGDRFAHEAHARLLDHLALDLIADGWSIKRAIRRIILTDAYAMASRPLPDSATRDPGNLLFHSARIRRLGGESLRDTLLTLSGRLDTKRFGPPVPTYITPFQGGRGKPDSGPLDGDGRRSIYLGVRRNFLSSWMLAFDTPNPFSTVGRRTVSNVPAQALVLLNDPLVHQQARLWAGKSLKACGNQEPASRQMLAEAFSRPAEPGELADASAFLGEQTRKPGTTPEDALTLLAQALINTKEFAYVR